MSDSESTMVHRQRLLQRRRCPRCAERVSARAVLKGAACRHCGADLRLHDSDDHAADVLGAIQAGWTRARLAVYAAVVGATFLTGWVPLLAGAVNALGLILTNLVLIRRPLKWLPPGRRMTTRFLVRSWLLVLILAAIAMNTLAAPLIPVVGSGAVLSAITGLVTTFLYVEGALMLVERGIHAQAAAS